MLLCCLDMAGYGTAPPPNVVVNSEDDVVRQAIIPLSAPHQSDAGATLGPEGDVAMATGIRWDSLSILQDESWIRDTLRYLMIR